MDIAARVRDALVRAGTTTPPDVMRAYKRALEREEDEKAAWILELLIKNARIAEESGRPLCDDTGIPHVIVEVGEDSFLPGGFFNLIRRGIAEGLLKLPGRPMAVRGDEIERIEQSRGLYSDPSKLPPAPFLVDSVPGDEVRIHVLLLGGGPEIRARTRRVFHRHSYRKVFEEVLTWMKTEVPLLGCTPCIPVIGIGRTHFEATSLMLRAMATGSLDEQSEIEDYITESLNSTGTGPLGLGGSTTALGSLVNVGPQRASGVRIVSMRLACCVEPRRATIKL
ncbi:fumarate hydratase [Methanothermobacter sp. KEPCO-1]|uniref:fumarate hydratase n=1 Tax=Methanothermobacter sp. KEPCO-1 TaxID=2603820 RepID=UPI0011CAC39E|nr:fumarate hydratase [Methanothermobacter sp. KEPCO-1]QEF94877.1 fumarate hydratase [Methanothermobacter sp. KEPCO-1]